MTWEHIIQKILRLLFGFDCLSVLIITAMVHSNLMNMSIQAKPFIYSYGITVTFSKHFSTTNLYAVSIKTLDLTSRVTVIELSGCCKF